MQQADYGGYMGGGSLGKDQSLMISLTLIREHVAPK